MSVQKLYKIGPAYAKKLQSLGIKTARDLLFYFPFRYDDFSDITKIADVETDCHYSGTSGGSAKYPDI